MRNICRTAFLSTLLLISFHLSLAQLEQAVSWEASYAPSEDLVVGQEVTLTFKATVDPGFTIYSAFPPEDWPSLGTEFALDETSQGVELVGRLEETGDKKTKYDDIFETDISYFEQSVTFYHLIRITAPQAKVEGFLRYQVCDDSRCVPGTYDFSYDLAASEKKKVDKAPASVPQSNEQAEARPTPPVLTPQEPASQVATPRGEVTLARDDSPEDRIKEPVSWTQQLVPADGWEVGDTLYLHFDAQIAPHFYVYSSIPPPSPANLPTKFELDPTSEGIEPLGPLIEEGNRQKKYDEVFEVDVQYFEGEVRFTQLLLITEASPRIEGFLDYQVCDSVSCIPATVEVSYGQGEEISASASRGRMEAPQKGLWQLILESFAWGFAAIFTPCVFPMIPLTVSVFTKQQNANTSRASGIRKAIFYGLSIVFIYTFLGILLSVLIGPEAMQRVANNPWVNVIFFLLLFLFGLSFLGWFDITLPSSWSTALGQHSGKGGLVGIFLMALTLAIVSFSCTAPLVSSALFQAVDTGSFVGPILSMMAFSTALALPFSLFALFPSWMQALPRSGGWLNTVKVTLGFLEIALALTYLSQADLIWHLNLLDREIMIGAGMVIFGMLGLYLLGKIQLPHDTPVERLSVPRLLLAMSSFWFVLYLAPGLWGAPLKMLAGFLPKPNSDMGVLVQEGQRIGMQPGAGVQGNDICTYPGKKYAELNDETPPGFCAFYDLEQGLAYAKAHDKPVFLDFTGHTCKNCRHVELNVWTDPMVRDYLTQDYVLVSLYTDDATRLDEVEVTPEGKKLRTVGDKWLQYQIDTYRSNTQPEYIILDHNNQQLLPSLGYTLDVETYRDYLEQGLEKFREQQNSRLRNLVD